jgi:hypothetical protein
MGHKQAFTNGSTKKKWASAHLLITPSQMKVIQGFEAAKNFY